MTTSQESAPLVRYDAMCRAIDAAYEVDEIKAIRDKAIAMEHYFRLAKNPEPERRACEIRLRAERKAGQLLKAEEKAKGTLKRGPNFPRSPSTTTAPTLASRGITKNQSSKWQQLAAIPDEQFEAALAVASKPSTNGLLDEAAALGVRAQAGAETLRPMDKQALWLWGRLRDFESDGLLARDQTEVLDEMTDAMRADVLRITPLVIEWLEGLTDEGD